MAAETPSSITAAVEYCLRPLVRLCIHFGLDYRTLSEMLKAAFVAVAEEDFTVPGKAQTDSRITLLTGVHRKDVRRLRGRAPQKATITQHQGWVAALISHWLGTRELIDDAGNPIPIPRNPQPDAPTSFTAIAEMLTQDIRPRALLDECINRGVVRLGEDDMVHLVSEALVPSGDLEEKAHFFGQTIHDHLSAAGHNLQGGGAPFLDRFVWHEDLTEDDVRVIAEASEKAAMTALKHINNRTLLLKQQQPGTADKGFRIHFGTFFFSRRSASHKDDGAG